MPKRHNFIRIHRFPFSRADKNPDLPPHLTQKYKNIQNLLYGKTLIIEHGCISYRDLCDEYFWFSSSPSSCKYLLEALDKTPQCYFDNLSETKKQYFARFGILSEEYKKNNSNKFKPNIYSHLLYNTVFGENTERGTSVEFSIKDGMATKEPCRSFRHQDNRYKNNKLIKNTLYQLSQDILTNIYSYDDTYKTFFTKEILPDIYETAFRFWKIRASLGKNPLIGKNTLAYYRQHAPSVLYYIFNFHSFEKLPYWISDYEDDEEVEEDIEDWLR